jgi:histidinol-phosphatase (PHP family)
LIKSDSHVHTSFSHDAKAPESSPEKVLDAAVEKGLDTVCITDHLDLNDPAITDEFPADEYYSTLLSLQKQYKDKIALRIGIELGLQKEYAEQYNAFTGKYALDMVIGSVHCINGADPYYGTFFEGKTSYEAYHEAFQYTLENLKTAADFDILGHIDYVIRYGNYGENAYSYELFREDLDAILRCVIGTGRGIEVNTSAFRYGLSEPHPCIKIIQRYQELGGEIITAASDAHKPKDIASDFQKLEAILTACGFRYYAVYKSRKPFFYKL